MHELRDFYKIIPASARAARAFGSRHPQRVKTTQQHNNMKRILTLTIAALLTSPLIINAVAEKPAETVVGIAAGNKDFSTLVAAVKAAGLVDTLSGDGPFTVFAPTNAAFAKLPEGTVAELLKPENKAKLTAILTYHVVAGKVMAADVKTGKVKTVQGGELDVKVTDSGVTVDGAKVVKTDIVGKNGVIHVIDSVVLPK
jgi:uncharacterized surface protein with fasciclin (FAS1) repeats